jgi:rhamnulose-1-phosphate aldolase
MEEIYSLSTILKDIGDAGQQVTALGAAEGSAGNISVFVRQLSGLEERFSLQRGFALPVAVPALAGGWVAVSGTGRRLRDLGGAPETTCCLLHIQPGGELALGYAGIDLRPTSELNSHLAIHQERVAHHHVAYHAVVHAQPLYLTYLSHLPEYLETRRFNQRLLRWEPETILVFPEGIGMLPFEVPGSPEQMRATLAGLQTHQAVIWQRHGIVVRSDHSACKAGDLIEYAETAAHYEYLNLLNPQPVEGLSDDDLRRICSRFGVQQEYF